MKKVFATVALDVAFCEIPVLDKVSGDVFRDESLDFDGDVSPWHPRLLLGVDQTQVKLINVGKILNPHV